MSVERFDHINAILKLIRNASPSGAAMKAIPSSRRIMRVSMSAHVVVEWFANAVLSDNPRDAAIPKLRGLPNGVAVLGVSSDWMNRTLDFLVEHASFPEVPDGQEVPVFAGPFTEELVIARLNSVTPDVSKVFTVEPR